MLVPHQPKAESSAAAAIWWITHEFSPFRGGAGVYVQEIARAAVRMRGASLGQVVTSDYHGRLSAADRATLEASDALEPYPLVRLKCSGRLSPAGIVRFAVGLRQQGDLLQQASPVLLSAGAQMAAFLLFAVGGFPVRRTICFFHGSELLRFGRHPLWRPLARRFFARAGGFAVASRYVQELAQRSGLLPAKAEIVLAPCAVPSAYLSQGGAEGSSASSEQEDPRKVVRILSVGRLHPRKGQLQVAQALALLRIETRRRLVYRGVGAGDPAYRQRIEAVCREAGIRSEFLGEVDERALSSLFLRCTVYVQASQTLPQSVEGFGISLLEAGFFGCPIAAFRSGGVSEAVCEGQNATLINEGDVAGLSGAIAELIENRELRQRYAVSGREYARGFSWERSARTLCELAESLRERR